VGADRIPRRDVTKCAQLISLGEAKTALPEKRHFPGFRRWEIQVTLDVAEIRFTSGQELPAAGLGNFPAQWWQEPSDLLPMANNFGCARGKT